MRRNLLAVLAATVLAASYSYWSPEPSASASEKLGSSSSADETAATMRRELGVGLADTASPGTPLVTLPIEWRGPTRDVAYKLVLRPRPADSGKQLPDQLVSVGTIPASAKQLALQLDVAALDDVAQLATEVGTFDFAVVVVDEHLAGFASFERGHARLLEAQQLAPEARAPTDSSWLPAVYAVDLKADIDALIDSGESVASSKISAAAEELSASTIANYEMPLVIEPMPDDLLLRGAESVAESVDATSSEILAGPQGIRFARAAPFGSCGSQPYMFSMFRYQDSNTLRWLNIGEVRVTKNARVRGYIKNHSRTTTGSVANLVGGGVAVSGQRSLTSSASLDISTIDFPSINGEMRLRKEIRYDRLRNQCPDLNNHLIEPDIWYNLPEQEYIPRTWTGGLGFVKTSSAQTWECIRPTFSIEITGSLQAARSRTYSTSTGLSAAILGAQVGVTQGYDSSAEWGITYSAVPGRVMNLCGNGQDISFQPLQVGELSDVVATTPVRVFNSGAGSRLAAGSVSVIQVHGVGGIGDSISGVFANITSYSSTGNGFLTAYKCGTSRPPTSNVNYLAGRSTTNGTFVELDSSGRLCLYALAPTHATVDIAAIVPGKYASQSAFRGVTPARAYDSRLDVRAHAGKVIRVPLGGRYGLPATPEGVFVNLTAVHPSTAGFLTAYNCGTLPATSTVNYRASDVVANSTMVALSSGGDLCVYTSAATDVLVDVLGSMGSTTSTAPIAPFRAFDSRSSTALQAGVARPVTVVNRDGVPFNPMSVFVTVSAVSPAAAGSISVYPCGRTRNDATVLSVFADPNSAQAGNVFARTGSNGQICLYSTVNTHAVVDVMGYVM